MASGFIHTCITKTLQYGETVFLSSASVYFYNKVFSYLLNWTYFKVITIIFIKMEENLFAMVLKGEDKPNIFLPEQTVPLD